jgi:hypothetical protein
MLRILIVTIFSIFIVSCNGQNGTKDKLANHSDEVKKPKTDIRVNKEYDDEGNLIRYDSTYTWSYSNIQGDSVFVDIDSAMLQFHSFMNDRRQFGFPFYNEDIFYNDSLFYQDFLDQDYFMNRWKESRYRMNRAIQEMDSIKSLFFRQNYPDMELEMK